jgi:hypothetical protein
MMLSEGVHDQPGQEVEGRRGLLHSGGEKGPDTGDARDPGDVYGEELVVPEEPVVGQRPGDREVDEQQHPEDPDPPGVESASHTRLEAIQRVEQSLASDQLAEDVVEGARDAPPRVIGFQPRPG